MPRIKTFLISRWRTIVTVLTFLLLAVVVYFTREQFAQTFRDLQRVNLWWIALIIPLQWLNFHTYAIMYQDLFRILGHNIKYNFMFRKTLELNFVNHVLPSGGVSGFSYFSLVLRKKGVSTAKSTLVQTMRFVFVFITYQVILFFALLLLALDGKANNFMIMVTASLTTLLLIGTLAVTFIVGSKKRINAFFTFITKMINKAIHLVRPKHPETIRIDKVKALFEEFHEDYMLLKSDWRQLKRPFIEGLIVNLTEVLTVYVVFLGFGHYVNLGVVAIAYAVANFAGLISAVPGGIGAYEALMIGVLTPGGVPLAVGLPVVIMYRVLCMVLQLPIGGYWYNQTLNKRRSNG